MTTRTRRSERPPATTLDALPPGATVVAGRYQLLCELGAGGMGTVYLARDRQTGESVALKQLSRADPKSVLRFKREFRSVAHLQHPNLVRLYDLECDPSGVWFLSMEYVPGVDLVSHLRPYDAPADIGHVIEKFGQVARGVDALHATGMLHRDLKPSNVLVATERVLLLDFGLVRGIEGRGALVTEEGMVSGTPAYMAPEQARAQALTEAADWYAFGVMLFEVLAGELPFDGVALEVMRKKIDCDAQPLAKLAPAVPRELATLCAELLRRDPAQRPRGAEILARLGADSPAAPPRQGAEPETTAVTDVRAPAAHFVGRADSLQQLQAALADVEAGQSLVVHVRGRSGAGKSALLERFLSDAERSAAAGGSDLLVLRSRCYELEAMPFKALDSIVDALVQDLGRRDDVSVSHLLPTDLHALVRVFPVLERVRAVKKLLGVQRTQSHARGERQRAEAALRELFARVARSRPLVVWLDDLHWGDLDSVAILRTWLELDTGAPFLLLLSYRSDEVETSPALRALLANDQHRTGNRVAERQLEIGPLPRAEMQTLCRAQLGAKALGRAELIEHIADEAEGNPFLASQLVSLALAMLERGGVELQSLSVDALVAQTQALLSPEASAVLEVLAVAGRPMLPRLALRAADVRQGGRAALHELRNLNLVRTRDADGERLIETHHDRIREFVYGRLSEPVLRAINNGLLRVLENSGRADPAWLHHLALGAEDAALALHYGLNAAERAHAALAFERAAELYRRCLELCEHDEVRCEIWRELGHVLGYSGRGVRAAEALLEAAKLCHNPSDALKLKRVAASHLLRSGHFEQGDALSDEVMAAAGIRAPRSESKLSAALVWERTLLGLRGMSFKQRSASEISPAVLTRLDLLEDMRIATQNHDGLRSLFLSTQSLRLALDAGEPSRIVRALSSLAPHTAGAGTRRGSATARDMLDRAHALAQEFGTARDRMELNAHRATVSFFEMRFKDVLEPSEQVERELRALPPDSSDATYFFKFSVRTFRVVALWYLDWARFLEECSKTLREALDTENVLALLMLAFAETLSDDILGQCEQAIPRLESQRALLPRERFTVLHVLHMAAVSQAACATRKHAWGFECLATYWPAFERSPLRANISLLTLAHRARARLCLNEYAEQREKPELLATAASSAMAIARANTLFHERFMARIAYFEGDHARARALLEKSAASFASRGAAFEVLRDECALGLLIGGEEGQRKAREALAAIAKLCRGCDATGAVRSYFPELAGSL